MTSVNLSPGERIAIEPSLTTSIEGLSQAFEAYRRRRLPGGVDRCA